MSTDQFHRPVSGPRSDSAYRSGPSLRSGVVLELAKMFALPAEHRQSDLVIFEELMTSLYASAPASERGKAAALLASRADLPPGIAAIMASDDIEIAGPVLTSSPALATIDRIRIIGNRGEAHRRAIAARPNLEDAVISALLIHGGAETIATLSGNAALALSPSQMDHLVDRVIEAGRTIETLPTALDLGPARRIDLFFELSATDRRRALLAFDAETAFRRIEKRGRRTPPSVRPGLQRQLIDAVFAGETELYAELLTEALGIDLQLGQRIVGDRGGEPLIVALLAVGLDATDTTSILVRSDPAFGWTYHTIRELVWLYEHVGWRTAEAVVERWSAAGGKRLTSVIRQTDGSERHVATERRGITSRERVANWTIAGGATHRT